MKKRKFGTLGLACGLTAAACAAAASVFLFRPNVPDAAPSAQPPSSVSVSPAASASSASPAPSFQNSIASAAAVNSDTVGWLYVPGTTINTPVVQTADNLYYLKHDLRKKYYWWGLPFADYRDTFRPLPKNLILYGHNMGDGKVFGQLKKYSRLDFLNAHPVLYFSTAGGDYRYEIFAVFITNKYFDYIRTDFASDGGFMDFIGAMRHHSMFLSPVEVAAQDRILTLSTCTYEFKNARFTVQARLMRPGENAKTAPSEKNPDPANPRDTQ